MKTDALAEYLDEITAAKQSFDGIEIYSGLEIDYIPDVVSVSDFASKLDYTIGSIHFVNGFDNRYWEIDNTREVFREGLEKIFRNDIRAAISQYFALTRQMINEDPPDILGHMDKIKINAVNVEFEETESWYIDEVKKTLKSVSATKTIIEVNTRGLYKKKSATTYPSPWIMERILDLGIPIMLNSDAHHPDELTGAFEQTRALLADIGFKSISVLTNSVWKQIPLNEYGSGT